MTLPVSHLLASLLFFTLTIILRWGFLRKFIYFCYQYIPKYWNQEFDDLAVRSLVGEMSKKLGVILTMIAVILIIEPAYSKEALIYGWITFFFVFVGSITFIGKFDLVKWLKTR